MFKTVTIYYGAPDSEEWDVVASYYVKGNDIGQAFRKLFAEESNYRPKVYGFTVE